MKLNDYQKMTERTAGAFSNKKEELVAWSMGIGGEAGEVVDGVKKVMFHGHELDPQKLMLELGDVMFYVARMANALGYTLEQVATANIEKLMKRYPNGFSTEASINRTE
ncbi:nucleoside triphosphate pyrophosphohydrolase family protein [Pullulanibacillus sp. KACC 23026]|uniref:nucleoside triphosphate pyrophosphohydrolase family protein n=1 Tax=Pullulanibacillus sp. KACC 23026 TaxID=3028315 RepID=UPI0023B11B38|nr:nucleoside triphosphate pyrophosphohydrolase family protein [Pullulanibacillus sp. KACC 23026]WEG14136.1 nucleoside triphosphate pyrophosphohydrolase family protein [Pullulanibacillus sp. KACC 23026]